MAAVTPAFRAGTGRVEPPAPALSTRLRTKLTTLRWWRFVVLGLAGLYFVIPLAAAARFSLEKPPNVGSGYWFGNYSGIFSSNPTQPFSSAAITTLELSGVTVAIVLALVVPTAIYIHLYTPWLRRVMDGITVLPIVIPAIVLIFGVLNVDPNWLKSTPYLLSLEYVMLAMPYVYRSLDAGLRAVDVKTLVEASRSLGGGWATTLFRVLVPNLRTGILAGSVLAVAVCVGEFTMASLDQVVTFQVWIYNTDQDSAWVSTAASVMAFLVTLVLLLGIVALDRPRGRRRLWRRRPSTDTTGGS